MKRLVIKTNDIFTFFVYRVPALLIPILLVLMIWQAAGLLWQILAPSRMQDNLVMPEALPSTGQKLADQALMNWFVSANSTTKTNHGAVQLIAVLSGSRGVAIFKPNNGESLALRVGEELSPGYRLVAVRAQEVEMQRGGQREILTLPKQEKAAVSASVTQVPSASPAPSRRFSRAAKAPETPSVSQETTSLTLGRSQLSDLVRQQNIANWSDGLSSYRDGGILIENTEAQKLAKALALRNGDVLQQINGKPLHQLEDVSLLFYEITQANTLNLNVLRDGSSQTLQYTIKP